MLSWQWHNQKEDIGKGGILQDLKKKHDETGMPSNSTFVTVTVAFTLAGGCIVENWENKDLGKCSDEEKKCIPTWRKIKGNYEWYLSVGFCFFWWGCYFKVIKSGLTKKNLFFHLNSQGLCTTSGLDPVQVEPEGDSGDTLSHCSLFLRGRSWATCVTVLQWYYSKCPLLFPVKMD